MLLHELGYRIKLGSVESACLLESNRAQPEFCRHTLPSHVDVGRFIPIKRNEEETVRTYPKASALSMQRTVIGATIGLFVNGLRSIVRAAKPKLPRRQLRHNRIHRFRRQSPRSSALAAADGARLGIFGFVVFLG